MTDEEFDVLDELYFVQSFEDLLNLTGKASDILVDTLAALYQKGWIKVMQTIDDEIPANEIDFSTKAATYFYLATKKGLMAHNTV